MAYKRKTRDEYEIQADYANGDGFECVNTEATWKDAKRSLRECRENDSYAVALRIKAVRVPIQE